MSLSQPLLQSPHAAVWQSGRFRLSLERPLVMGIVNLTPDSFSDGGSFVAPRAALAHAERLLIQGADILDLGAESSRPGSPPVPEEVELQRLLPVLREAVKLGRPVSVDTCKPGVMRAALDLGADIINDIWALRQPGAVDVVAGYDCGICLMHMHREPRSMQQKPMQGDVPAQVVAFFSARLHSLEQAGLSRQRMVLDPGIGFGKTVEQNFSLLAGQDALLELGCPLLAGWSRKSSLGAVTGRQLHERMPASVAAALLAIVHGAHIVRVHDVAATCDAIEVWQATQLAAQGIRMKYM